jgi:hypothetical protein
MSSFDELKENLYNDIYQYVKFCKSKQDIDENFCLRKRIEYYMNAAYKYGNYEYEEEIILGKRA